MSGHIMLPNGDKLDIDWCKEAIQRIKQLQRELNMAKAIELELVQALRLAKDMFVANDCSLPHTFEVMDTALDKAVINLGLQQPSASGAKHDDTY